MKRMINYSFKLTIIIILLVMSKTTANMLELQVENNNINKTINLTTMAMKVVEANAVKKYTAKDTFTGDLTGYAYNCPLCNGTLACAPKYNVKNGTTTYPDEEYGEVFIVASSKNLECGSIIRFTSDRVKEGESYAIVLDRGVLGNALDLLVPSEQYALDYIGRSSITYDVLRNGWQQSES